MAASPAFPRTQRIGIFVYDRFEPIDPRVLTGLQSTFGTPGADGESEMETTSTPEARQQASRAYQQKYMKCKQESDAVLEGEPRELGRRQGHVHAHGFGRATDRGRGALGS